MKNNNALTKKLLAYSGLAAGFLSAKSTNAQIIYTDVVPDNIIVNSDYSLDLNNDGIVDFKISNFYSIFQFNTGFDANGSAYVSGEPGNSVAFGFQNSVQNYASVIQSGDQIGANLNFAEDGFLGGFKSWSFFSGADYGAYIFGDWNNKDKKFVGLRLSFNGETYYGWARLSVDWYFTKITVLDYAYETTPNTPIAAGDIGCVNFYPDSDNDQYGSSNSPVTLCELPLTGYSTVNTDCNDANASIHPGACDGTNDIDDNCDGIVDNGFGTTTFYVDADGDGYGNLNVHVNECSDPAGYVLDNTDCDDANASTHPGATDIANGIDDNCNGLIDECLTPFVLSTTGVTATGATLNWNAIGGASQYKVRYRSKNTSWTKVDESAGTLTLIIANLQAATKYKWQIRVKCDGVYTPWSSPQYFTTLANRIANDINQPVGDVNMFPNPTSGNATIEVTLSQPQSLSIQLFDLLGREVFAEEEGNVSGTFSKQLDLTQLTAGTYFLKVIHGDESEMRKVVVEK